MKSIRIGNDINIEWSIFRDGTPYVLEELDLSLYLKNIFGRERIEDYAISGNKVMWTFHGKDQEHIGKYTLELVINEQKPGMATTDYVDFVYLTPKTSCCQGEDEENITTETIVLSSTMEFAPTVIQGEGGSGLKYSEERTIYGLMGTLTEEERAYNVETFNKTFGKETGYPVLIWEGMILQYFGEELADEGEENRVRFFYMFPDRHSNALAVSLAVIYESGSVDIEFFEMPLGGGSIDPETIEGFIPLSRDFSDDFNNDFAR